MVTNRLMNVKLGLESIYVDSECKVVGLIIAGPYVLRKGFHALSLNKRDIIT